MDNDRWQRRSRRIRPNPGASAFAGIVLVGVGVIFLLVNTGYLSPQYVRFLFREFWPVLLILLGLKMLVLDRGAGDAHLPQGAGLFWVAFGAFFLLSNFSVINVAFRTIWPFFPLAIGAFILFKVFVDRDDLPGDAKTGGQPAPDDAGFTSNSRITASASMGHVSRRSNSQEFRGGSVTTFLGMCEVDLRGASPAGGEAVMNVSTFLGGIEIRVPTDWTVVNTVSPFLGGVEDKTEAPKHESKRLILRGSALLGGVEVRN